MGNLAVCGGGERKDEDGSGSAKPGKFVPPAAEESKNEPKQGRYGKAPESLVDRGGDGKEQEGNRFITNEDL
eukprot:g2610.t1